MTPRYEHPMLSTMSPDMRVTFLQELADGYCQAAIAAEWCRQIAAHYGDRREEKAWGRHAFDSWVMAEYGFIDLPERQTSKYSYDEAIRDDQLAAEELREMFTDEKEEPTNKEEAALRAMALSGGLATLTEKEQETFKLYEGSDVSRTEAPEMLGIKATLTFDTHVRNYNTKLRTVREIGYKAF